MDAVLMRCKHLPDGGREYGFTGIGANGDELSIRKTWKTERGAWNFADRNGYMVANRVRSDGRPHSAAFEDVEHFKLSHRNGMADCRCSYSCEEVNGNGERMSVELSYMHDYSVAALWYKNGYCDYRLSAWWSLSVSVTDADGFTWQRYNPQIGKDHKLQAPWAFLDATEQNARDLLAEVHRLFMAGSSRDGSDTSV